MIREEEPQEEQQQQQSAMPYYQPTIMPSEKSDLFDKIRPEDTVETIKYMFMGYEFDKKRMTWVLNEAFKSKALTEIGAWSFATLMLSVSSKNVAISKLNDSEIRERTKSLIKTAMKMALRNWKEYGIKGGDQIHFIKEVILSNSFITLKQPENAGVREFIKGTSSETKVISEQGEKRGGFSSIFRR